MSWELTGEQTAVGARCLRGVGRAMSSDLTGEETAVGARCLRGGLAAP